MPTPARVLILVQNEPVPADRHVWNECRALTGAGYEVTVICPVGEDRDRDAFEHLDGVDIHRYQPRTADGGAIGFAIEYASAVRQMRRIARRLAADRPFDIVHACSPPDFLLLAALPLRRQGAHFVFDHHDLTPELVVSRFGTMGRLIKPITLLAEQVAFRLADVVLSVNDSYRKVALTRGRRKPDEVFVVRTGPDLTRFTPVEPDPALKRGRTHLLSYVGVMGPQDGVDHALRALAELQRRRQDWHAIFMGSGEVLEDMKALAVELGIGDRVEFSGWVGHDYIRAVLCSSDACIAPDPSSPLNDKSSMVKLSEYMAMSRPIVSYDLPESRIAAAGAAVYARANDPADFARAMDELLDDPQRRAEMREAGRVRCEDVLAWEHQERSLLAAYAKALAPAGAPVGEPVLEPARV